MTIVKEIRCSNCGAPMDFSPGEIVASCRYCGFTQVIQTGKVFEFEHSMILNSYTTTQVDDLIHNWMRAGFLKPRDLVRSSKIVDKKLMYLPFWVISISANSTFKGIFERLSPPIIKDGKIDRNYDWLVLARKATDFPIREYDIPLKGKVPYDFKKIDGNAKVLNSEIDKEKAVEIARQQIKDLHRFLAKQDIDKMIEIETNFDVGDAVYLHSPIWFIVYIYKNKRYHIHLDGAIGTIIKGDIPPAKFGLI